MEASAMNLVLLLLAAFLVKTAVSTVNSLLFSPLYKFKGPALAASDWYQTVGECFLNWSFCHKLVELHAHFGDVIRIGSNELHFADPQAYQDIYNSQNRWDKEPKLYHSFNEDRSSFGYLTYKEAKPRKDTLNKLFSARAITQTEGIVLEKVDALCAVFERLSKEGKAIDLNLGFRCMTIDIITYLCFGRSADAIDAPDFQAPIIQALDASLPGFKFFHHFPWYKNMILGCPPELSKKLSPPTAGLVDLQVQLLKQIDEITKNPATLDGLPHQMTIYHQLIGPESKEESSPPAGSIFEESQALMFAGSDTTGNTLMHGFFELLRRRDCYTQLKDEVRAAWPKLGQQSPSLQDLEKLPYLTAVIKESLRLSCGVVSGLLRMVPEEGATICGTFVPGGTAVSCGSTFVSFNAKIFPDPTAFKPERWLNNPSLDQWLVAFSKGPRSCLGINLAWLELRLGFAHFVRRFDMELDPSSPAKLEVHDCFLPVYLGNHVKARVMPASS